MHGPRLLNPRLLAEPSAKIMAYGLDDARLTPEQNELLQMLEKHRVAEFEKRDVDQTLATMTAKPYLLFLASLTGGEGQTGVKRFYKGMITQIPDDLEWELISRTVGDTQIVVESILKFTHNVPVDWIIPGAPPTDKKVEIPMVLIFTFESGRLASERIYWDQASVLVQLDLLEPRSLPIVGVEAPRELRRLTSEGADG